MSFADWLEHARAVHPTYPESVLARHAAAEAEYHDSWKWCTIESLCTEVCEEGVDVGGWAMLVGERTTETVGLGPDTKAEAAALVLELATLGATVLARAQRLRELVS